MRAESPTAATILFAAAALETSRATMSRSRESGIQTSLEGLLQARYWAQNSDGLRLLHQVQADPLNAPVLQIEFPGSFVGLVDNAAVDHRTAIVDPDYERPAIAQVRDFHERPEGQGWMGRREVVHVERLTAGGFLAVEIASVPGRSPNLIRFRLLGKLRLGGWFRLRSYRATLVACRPRVALSRSQAGDAEKHRQSMSNTSSHSVHLASKWFGNLRRSFSVFGQRLGNATGQVEGLSTVNCVLQDDQLVIHIARNLL